VDGSVDEGDMHAKREHTDARRLTDWGASACEILDVRMDPVLRRRSPIVTEVTLC